MALMLAICRAQPNWMPRKPKHAFQICQKLISRSSFDDERAPFVGTEGQWQSPGSVDLACDLLLDDVPDFCARSRVLDGDGLANGRPCEVDGGDLDPFGLREPVHHDHQTARFHNRDVDLLALVDAVC